MNLTPLQNNTVNVIDNGFGIIVPLIITILILGSILAFTIYMIYKDRRPTYFTTRKSDPFPKEVRSIVKKLNKERDKALLTGGVCPKCLGFGGGTDVIGVLPFCPGVYFGQGDWINCDCGTPISYRSAGIEDGLMGLMT